MDESLRIQIELLLRTEPHRRLSARVVVKAITAVDAAIMASERKDLRLLRDELSGFPGVAFDAAEQRLGSFRGAGLQLERAESSSILLIGAVAGISIFILQNTLGETLKEAWLDSDGHRRLKGFLLRQRHIKPYDIASQAVSKLLRALPTAPGVTADVRPGSDGSPSVVRLTVPISEAQENVPPPREDLPEV